MLYKSCVFSLSFSVFGSSFKVVIDEKISAKRVQNKKIYNTVCCDGGKEITFPSANNDPRNMKTFIIINIIDTM